MPLFKRRDKKEDGEQKDKQKEEAKPEEGAEEAPKVDFGMTPEGPSSGEASSPEAAQ